MACALAACTESPILDPGGTPDAGGLVVAAPAPPAPPAAPQLLPCPAGFRQFEAAPAVAACDPWPESGRLDCPEGLAHFPGTGGCAPLGAECPADGWPAGLPSGVPTLFVKAGASGGDGTRGAPLGRIGEALAAVPSGGIVAVAAGTYDEDLALPANVTLWGACAARTRIVSSRPGDTKEVIGARRSGSVVRDLTVGGARPAIRAHGALADLTVEGVAVESATSVGMVSDDGARLVVRRSIVRGIRPAEDLTYGLGLFAADGASLSGEQLLLEGNSEAGVVSLRGARIELSHVAVIKTRPRKSDDKLGYGAVAAQGGVVALAACALEENLSAGALALGGEVTVEGCAVREISAPPASRSSGVGVAALSGGTARARRLLVARAASVGLLAEGQGSALFAEDAVVLDVRGWEPASEDDEYVGEGLAAVTGGSVEASRVVIAGYPTTGALAINEGSSLTLFDVAISGGRGTADGRRGYGIDVSHAASGRAGRIRIDRARGLGVICTDAGRLGLSDVAILRTQDGHFGGRALEVESGSSMKASRVELTGNREAAIVVAEEGARLDAEDLRVVGTLSEVVTGRAGWGLAVQWGATVRLSRASFEGNREIGVGVGDARSSLTASDLAIVGTLENDCAHCDMRFGVGLANYLGASTRLERFRIAQSARIGLLLTEGSSVDLAHGEVSGNPVGLNVQAPGFDLARLQQDVAYRDNGTNLATDSLPLPALPPLGP